MLFRSPRHEQNRRIVVRRLHLPYRGRDNSPFLLPLIPVVMEYSINKGIGETVEYKGLKAQYLFIFAAGLLALFVLFVVMYMCGVPQWFCIGFGAVLATALVALTFRLNARYGRYGLMKVAAVKYHPRYIINRRRLTRIVGRRRKEVQNEKHA